MAIPWGAIITAGSSLVSGLLGKKGAEETNARNAEMADKQMDFQERMSSTAHQREVADLKAAGLNPLLSANSGASTPGGAMATFQNPNARVAEDISTSAKSFAELSLNKELIKTQQSQQALNAATAAKTIADTKPRAEIAKAIDVLGNAIAQSARWIGEKTANIDVDWKGVHRQHWS